MTNKTSDIDSQALFRGDSAPLLQSLAEFRYQLRNFLQFSEHAAQELHLHPQQHQLLLQIAGAPEDASLTIAYAAERLGLRHHSVVELVDRSVTEMLLRRREDPTDRRRVLLEITPKGEQILATLSGHHARELRELGPRLIRSLQRIETAHLQKEPPR
ncbi:MAG: Transcriptional regulator, MarR family [Acidobacteriaceae bacterium]|nr:Transcriptional regulator, MarR family [Acidobacteriaceae bacterium]